LDKLILWQNEHTRETGNLDQIACDSSIVSSLHGCMHVQAL
jgi:hypothetical protein